MGSHYLRMILSSLVILVIILLFSPVLRLKQEQAVHQMNVRQKVEQIYLNEIHNALRADDVFTQMWTLRHALLQIYDLRKKYPQQDVKDEKIMNRRVLQIRKMIAKEMVSEVL